MHNKILVIGSTNTDLVVKTTRLPVPGETILGGDFFVNPGGKGANQAVAAVRLGGKVTFIAKTGNDIFGTQAKELFKKEKINCEYVFVDDTTPSGVALITVDEKGENCIVVASGANNNLSAEEVLIAVKEIESADIVLMQLETPLETIEKVTEAIFRMKKKIILNPAPARQLPERLYKYIFLITPNETEAEILTGVRVTDEHSAQRAAEIFHKMGVEMVIITMGSSGAYIYESGKGQLIEAQKVVAIDTTAAGDVFNGAVSVGLAQGKTLKEAVVFGNKAAAISVTRLGAQSSAPYLNEISINPEILQSCI